MPLKLAKILSGFIVVIQYCNGILFRDNIGIDLNDILSEKLMPMSMIDIESTAKFPLQFNGNTPGFISRQNISENDQAMAVGDFSSALSLMNFHR